MRTSLSRALTVLWLAAAACGGKVAPIVEELPFAPETRTAGYGLVGGWHVTLVDASVPGRTRTLHIDAAGLDGRYDVAAGGARVTFKEDGRTSSGESGTVVVTTLPPAHGSLGSVAVHVDLLVPAPDDGARELHVVGDWVADVTFIG